MKKKLCIITGTRAEWGLFYPLARQIKRSKSNFILQVIATGAHLSKEYGMTCKEIEEDGFSIDKRVKIFLKKDNEEQVAKAVASGISALTGALKSLKPDIVFLLGDRFEAFSAAVASYFLKIPIAHIHGGEVTKGSLDDGLRHSISKLAKLHFVSTEAYRKRLIQMGEEPHRVFNVGALGLDNIKNTRLLSRTDLEKRLNFKFGKHNILVTFNPSTAEDKACSQRQFDNMLKVLEREKDTKVIFTKPNPDMYSRAISKRMDEYASKDRKRLVSFASMGRVLYLSTLQFVDMVIGNSSSGIIEAPSFGIPTINIGNRQNGRLKSASVIDADGSLKSIEKAFKKVSSPYFKRSYKGVKNIYGDGNASLRIIEIIKKTSGLTARKAFYDIAFHKKQA